MDPIAFANLWNWVVALFVDPIPVFGLGLARAVIGLLVVVDGLRHLADANVWLNPNALGHRPTLPRGCPKVVVVLHDVSWRPRVFVVVHCVFALMLALGIGGGLAAVLVFLTFRRIHQANRYVLYGGDAVLRMAVLTLALSPCTTALSIDRWIAAGDLGLWVEASPWGMRFLQIEMSVLYFYNCWYKIEHEAWRKGTAVYYPLQNTDIRNVRLPIPGFMFRRALIAAGTWGTLLLECTLGPGLWIEELRLPLVIGAAVLHLAIAYAFSLWLFSYIMLGCLCVFVDPTWLGGGAPFDAPVRAWGPSGTPLLEVAVVLSCLYVVFAVFWDPPHRSLLSQGIRHYFGTWIKRAGIVRRWRLFSGNPPANRTVTLVLTMTDDEGRVTKWGWNQTIGLFGEDPLLEKRTVWNHRLRKYASSLLRQPVAQQRFGKYILHRNLYTYVAPSKDEKSLTALACSLAGRSGSPIVVEVLVYLAARAIREQRSDANFLGQLQVFALNANWPPVAAEELDGTRQFVAAAINDEVRRQLYFDILDALSGDLAWEEVFTARESGANS